MTNGAIHVTAIAALDLVSHRIRGRIATRYMLLRITGSASFILREAGSAGIAEGLHPLNVRPAHTCESAVRKLAPRKPDWRV